MKTFDNTPEQNRRRVESRARIFVSRGLCTAPQAIEGAYVLVDSSNRLNVLLHSGARFHHIWSAFEQVLDEYASPIRRIRRLLSRLRLNPRLSAAVVIFATFLGFELFQLHFPQVISASLAGSMPEKQSLVITTLCVGIAFLVFLRLPVLFRGENSELVASLGQFLGNIELRRRAPIIRSDVDHLFGRLSVKGRDFIHIWNVQHRNVSDPWLTAGLIIPILSSTSVSDGLIDLCIHTRHEDVNKVVRELRAVIDAEQLRIEIKVKDSPAESISSGRAPKSFLSGREHALLDLFCAMTVEVGNASSLEMGECETVRLLSINLVRGFLESRVTSLDSLEGEGAFPPISVFVMRCVKDYGFLRMWKRPEGHAFYSISVFDDCSVAQRLQRLVGDYALGGGGLVVEATGDPVAALFVLKVALTLRRDEDPIFTKALNLLVETCYKAEEFDLLRHRLASLRVPISPGAVRQGLGARSVFQLIDGNRLRMLATVLQRTRDPSLALEAYEYLERVMPLRAKVDRIYPERRLSVNLELLVDRWLEVREKFESQRASATIRLELSLKIAWEIASAGLQSRMEMCGQLLKEAEAIFESQEGPMISDISFSLFNTKAQYLDVIGKPEAALDCYFEALLIPGLDKRLLSSVNVNIGISKRKLATSAIIDSRSKALELFDEAIRFGTLGVRIKESIGDFDQLVIATHNLAETYLRAATFSQDDERRAERARLAAYFSYRGLSLGDTHDPTLKRLELLAEFYLAGHLLGKCIDARSWELSAAGFSHCFTVDEEARRIRGDQMAEEFERALAEESIQDNRLVVLDLFETVMGREYSSFQELLGEDPLSCG